MKKEFQTDKRMVTVITLSYQSEHLFEAIDSVLEQTYNKIQYIISDDGSNNFQADRTKKYINNHNKGNICDLIILHHKDNIGTVRNLNRALTFVKGQIIIYLSADDIFYDRNVIQDWVDFFSDGKTQVASALRIFYDHETKERHHILPSQEQIQLLLHGKKEKLFDALVKENFIPHCNLVFTKHFMEKYMPYDERYRLIEDYPMNLKLARMGVSFGFFYRISILYGCHGASSPLNLNHAYLKDANRIYKHEILPYTKHPYKNRFYYLKGEFIHINESHFLKGYNWCKQHPAFWIMLAFAHPVKAYRKIIRTVKNVIQRGIKT